MKTTFILISLLMLLSVTITAQIPTNGLISYWSFTGNANDESGNGYNGTINGATLTTDRFGNPNCAFSFDGVNDNLVVSGLLNNISSSSITVSVWVMGNSAKSQSLFCDNVGSQGNRVNCHLYFGTVPMTYWDFGNIYSGGRINCNINSAQLHVWEHWVFIADSTTHTMEIYRNGVVECSSYTAAPHFSVSNLDFWIGGGNASYFDGKIDDFRIYDWALDSSAVIALYNESVCNTPIPVTITNLSATYTTNDPSVALVGTPSGGTFYGTGILSNIFYPNSAGAGSHTIVYTYQDTSGCSGAICQDVTITTFVKANENKLNEPNLNIYPNPSNGDFRIEFIIEKRTDITIKITNTLEQTVYNKKFKNQTGKFTKDINIDGLSKGLYIVTLLDGNNSIIEARKVVIE